MSPTQGAAGPQGQNAYYGSGGGRTDFGPVWDIMQRAKGTPLEGAQGMRNRQQQMFQSFIGGARPQLNQASVLGTAA